MDNGAQVISMLEERFADAVVGRGEYRGQHWVELKLDRLVEVARWLREDDRAAFDHLVDLTAVHWPDDDPPMEVVYHLFSYSRNDLLRMRVRTGDRGPVPSLSAIWKSADWNERETWDMFGIEFSGHPDLRRILMPDDYTDHPLRKELPLYRG